MLRKLTIIEDILNLFIDAKSQLYIIVKVSYIFLII